MTQGVRVGGERKIAGVLNIDKTGRHVSISGTLTGFLFKEGRTWVAYCQGLDLSSCGMTEARALEAMSEAVNLWFGSCIGRGKLEEALAELGWVCKEYLALLGKRKRRG